MLRPMQWTVGLALLAVLALILAACGPAAVEKAQEPGKCHSRASTPRYAVAFRHPRRNGQSFWDIERHGALAAAAKDNFTLRYSNNPDPPSRPP